MIGGSPIGATPIGVAGGSVSVPTEVDVFSSFAISAGVAAVFVGQEGIPASSLVIQAGTTLGFSGNSNTKGAWLRSYSRATVRFAPGAHVPLRGAIAAGAVVDFGTRSDKYARLASAGGAQMGLTGRAMVGRVLTISAGASVSPRISHRATCTLTVPSGAYVILPATREGRAVATAYGRAAAVFLARMDGAVQTHPDVSIVAIQRANSLWVRHV